MVNTLRRISVIVRCPHCRRAMRWTDRCSRHETCPSCQEAFIILHDEGETFQVAADSGGAVAEMIYAWLMPDRRDDDDDEAQGEVPQLESKSE
jgi:Zn-finger nucleic acid-binding protein